MDAESRTAAVADAPVAAELTGNTSRTYKFIKRAFDIVASAVGLVLCIPIFIVAGIAIKLEDPKGPVFYHQPRIGLYGREFTFYKLRSMYMNADAIKSTLMDQNEMDGPVFKMRDDPRVTKVGHFLRRTSIDELPQLWNTLKGDMSLVGPRPLPVAEELACNAYQRQRELVKPGLTCYWQISGRNDVMFDEWIELDLKYIREQSAWTDMKLITKTIGAVARGGVRTRGRLYRFIHRANTLTRVVKAAVCFPVLLLLAKPAVEAGEEIGTKAGPEIQKTSPGVGYRVIKRAFDIAASAVGLVVVSPILLVTILAIVLEDGASPFFMQPRIGKDCKPFRMVKLRSMRPNAEQILAQLSEAEKEEFSQNFKLRNDPRITKVGYFIRKASIDELPQLWNVLRGDMSIVGPRPPLLVEEKAYGEHLAKVMSVRPGITGYWQVHGRSETDFNERIKLNEYYIDHRSLGLDLKILFETVRVVFTGRGAL